MDTYTIETIAATTEREAAVEGARAHDAYEAYRDSLQIAHEARSAWLRAARRVLWARYEEMALLAEQGSKEWNPLQEAVVMMRIQPLCEELERLTDELADARLGVLLAMSEIAEYA